MDEKSRNSGTETNDTEESPQKPSRRRRTPSAEPSDKNDVKSKRRSRSHSRSRSKTSRSRSPSRGRRRRSRSRGHYSPDRRYGRFNRGGYQRDSYNRRRRSPSRSPNYRGRRNVRRSRSTSFDRYRNRRNLPQSRERSTSQGDNRAPQAPPAPNFQNDYVAPHYQAEYPVAQTQFPNQFGNYTTDYVPIMQAPPPTAYPPYPPPPTNDYMWNTQVPPPPIISCAPTQAEPAQPILPTKPVSEPDEEKQKREAAIAAEKKIQRDTIRMQRDDYKRRASALKRELITLKEQREELVTGNEPPSPTTNGFIKENDRLQSQIENKIGTIENVIEMLNGILSADKSDTESPKKPKPTPKPPIENAAHSDDSSPERLKTKVIESLSKKRKDSDRSRVDEKSSKSIGATSEQINYTFFDPEQHWCKVCSAFPKTAKEYLLHLHSDEHKNNAKPPDIPWHDNLLKDDMPTYPNAPTKRTPIRGLQFFVPSTAWYCKLCSFWIGDLHCASSHLKSKTHSEKYEQFILTNSRFENDWLEQRQQAFDLHRDKEKEQSHKVIAPPSPPIISSSQNVAPPPPSMGPPAAFNRNLFDGIPLQINQRPKETKEILVKDDESEKKKGKKKKKEKKKRKKSKKKHRHSSSSSSTSSEESSASESPERKASLEKPAVVDTATSIRVTMRNAVNAPPVRAHLKPKSDEEDNIGGWTVVQPEHKAIPPKPPTISANGEAQNRRDDAMISQWTPLPVISEKEKQLFEQLKGKLKHREDKKKEKTPPAKPAVLVPTVPQVIPAAPSSQESNDRTKTNDKRREGSEKDFKDVKERDRRDTYRKRRSRSTSSPRRDSRRSRSPRRDRRRRSPSPPLKRDRRYSRSPRRDPRDRRRDRYSRSRSKSRDRRSEKNDAKSDKNNKNIVEKSTATKKSTPTATGKKLPFIGRMPVFKKQSTDDDSKKLEPTNEVSEEEKLIQKKKQDELKFQIHQKQQLLQMQQKQAEAYNLAHPGQFANIYNTHGTIHHLMPTVQPEEYDLMPDPTQYVTMMAAPPPPMPEPEVPHFEEASEPVLPPGIDVEEAESMELETVVPPPPPASDNDNLPKDFQDALSIIFDKGAEKSNDDAPVPAESDISKEKAQVAQVETPTFAHTDSQPQHIEYDQTNASGMGAANMEIDDQSQHYMLYGDENYVQNHVHQSMSVPSADAQSADLTTQSIPTPPIQMLDAAGNLTQIPGPVLEVSSDFVMLDPDGNRIDHYSAKNDAGPNDNDHESELQKHVRKQQELDDLAMLGIDADDLAAQCI